MKHFTASAESAQPTYRWVLQYSSIAFALLVLMQSYGVFVGIPQFEKLLAGFGGGVSLTTQFALDYYWTGCVVNAIVSISAATYIWFRPRAAEVHLKIAYGIALLVLVAAFTWSGFVVAAVYQPIFSMGARI